MGLFAFMEDNIKQQIRLLIDRLPAIEALVELICQQQLEAWLVGGVLRDLVLQRSITDIDLATMTDPTPLAKQWARQVGGRWFWLDQQRQQSRVLLSNKLTVDFSPLRARSINEDLFLRDFTINSLAFPLHDNFTSATILNPLNTLNHLQQKILQTCSRQSFSDDPLRMLKGVRHLVTLDLQIKDKTCKQMLEHAPLLERVAGERIRDELMKILSATNCFPGIELLLETGLLKTLFGPAAPSWNQSVALKKLQDLEQQMHLADMTVSEQSNSAEIKVDSSQKSLFLLAALLKCYQVENLTDLLHRRLRLSRQQQRLVLALQKAPSADWFVWSSNVLSSRQQALLVEQLGEASVEQLLYLAICPNPLSYKRALELLRSFNLHQQLGRIPDLLSGEKVHALLPGQPGQAVGLWQQQIKVAEITGKITTRIDACNLIKGQISI